MKIIIFFILFTVQAQYDDELVTNNLNLITRNDKQNTLNQFTIDEMKIATNIHDLISSDDSSYTRQPWEYFSTNNYDLTTLIDEENILYEKQWFNINQTHRRDSSRSFLFWKYTNSTRKGANYILRSEPRCIRQMCSVKLKYNGTLSTRTSGCLSFSLRIQGQPVGQLWIVEDQEQENTLQKIEFINRTLHIERTLRSKIKNLTIETKVLFHNPQNDVVYLLNLNINWQGPCPKNRSVSTPSSHIINRRSTLQDDFMTLTSEGSGIMNTLITNDEFYDSTTIVFNHDMNTKHSFSFFNQKNIGWSLSLISIFCFLIVLSAIGHSLWLIRRHYHYTWHVTFDSQIQFLSRRSIRSSTRSENKIATISQISYDILQNDLQKDISITATEQSTPISYYTYL